MKDGARRFIDKTNEEVNRKKKEIKWGDKGQGTGHKEKKRSEVIFATFVEERGTVCKEQEEHMGDVLGLKHYVQEMEGKKEGDVSSGRPTGLLSYLHYCQVIPNDSPLTS